MFSKFLYFTVLVFVVTACTSNPKMESTPRCPQSEGNGHIGSGDTGSSKPVAESQYSVDVLRSKCYSETPTRMEQIYVMAATILGHPIYTIRQLVDRNQITSNLISDDLYYAGLNKQFNYRIANSKSCWQAISEYANFETANSKSFRMLNKSFALNEYGSKNFDQKESDRLFKLAYHCAFKQNAENKTESEFNRVDNTISYVLSAMRTKLGRKTVLSTYEIKYSMVELFYTFAINNKAQTCEDINRAYDQIADILIPVDIETYNSLKRLNYDIDQYLILQ